MTDRAGFLHSIVARPDDDLPRLAFADWLEENGEPERAEFVRVQCELARTPARNSSTGICVYCSEGRCDCECRHCVLRRRSRVLLRGTETDPGKWGSNSWEWFVGQFPGVESAQFRRGFVDEIGCSWNYFHTHAPALLSSCPIRNAKDGVVKLMTWPDPSDFGLTDTRRVMREIELMERYPGVRFELPRAYGISDSERRRFLHGQYGQWALRLCPNHLHSSD